MKVTDILSRYSQRIDEELEVALTSIDPMKLYDASGHLIKAGGKKIRPTLVVLSCEAVGGKAEDALKAAASIELIHTFSLIHDDIMDKDEMRRGEPSVHVIWGEPMAILAGDTLFSKAFESLLKTETKDLLAERIIYALKTVVDSCIKICEGQAYDICFEEKFDVKKDEYFNMIYKKTAALIAAATKSGAILGSGSEKQIEALTEYGKLIGMAFQIQDDCLDIVSDEEKIGKPKGSDIVEGKMTLMVVHALENASSADKKRLISILKENNQGRVEEVIEIFNKYGSIDYARNIALKNVKTAKKMLDVLNDSDAKDALILIADFVLERKY
ncbi:MAG: polyprenyl synthetase family protein [Euryarchaeota archaeon]|nr:polyprenyl synthetase family protein [Euryarchaeota archaeon]